MEGECLSLVDLSSPRKREQKENICTMWRKCTPTEPGVPVMKLKGGTPDPVDMTPVKQAAEAEPWSPTANLRMLINAASPDIRNREMRKVLFRPIENESESADIAKDEVGVPEDACQFEAMEEEDDREKKPSRKQKSLGLLCQKFLALYPDYPPSDNPIWISLDEVATSLGVERRRIYDIVNVLESLMMVGRMAKNSYTWHGRLRLNATLQELQRQGRQHGYQRHTEPGHSLEGDGGEDDSGHAPGNRKEKSLRIMSQKFVTLFLVSRTQTVTLEAAAKVLIEESQDSSSHSKYKTKVRRLYDIANVLTSLNLIKKVHVREEQARKPAFRWLGPVDFNKSEESVVGISPPEAQDLRNVKLAQRASFGIASPSAAVQPQVCSAPSSPRNDINGFTPQPLDYSKKTGVGKAVCRLQFGSHDGNLVMSSQQPTLLFPALHQERLFTIPSSAHCLAYLPGLSQASVVMPYNRPDVTSEAECVAEGSGSPGEEPAERRKRRNESLEEEMVTLKKSPSEASDETGNHASHYLYLPNNSGLNSLNLLLPSGQPSAHLSPGAITPLALPYVLVPSTTLSQVGYNLPARYMVAAAPYGLAPEVSPVRSPSTPEQSGRGGMGAAQMTTTPQPLTPPTPKEIPVPTSRSFFQTPGNVEGVGATPVLRKRGSVQRRLDVSHSPPS
ncbi:transcription factor E2F7 [Corythoichthys intestinalis]|uniref:transcription factor E2F7 n=1 Tax=Corythoichthys intestinalis TaxID=161448 RepID=UPI0025A59624|nr:transcription factor E2F7 [Corythoichthys intestinalis]XP_061809075.1 transcription factor E2F7-like [Nerophis lumbriciformis]